MDMDFVIPCKLVRYRMPLSGSCSSARAFASTLLSDISSRIRPCASLSLRLHQAVKGTFTLELLDMLGTHAQAQGRAACSAPPAAPGWASLLPSCRLLRSNLL